MNAMRPDEQPYADTPPEVLAALDFLEAQTDARWPFEQFRKVLAPREGELDLDRVGRSQVLNASLNGIKRAMKREA